MPLRGIYDGGGVRKQNGHYQSSSMGGWREQPGRFFELPCYTLLYDYDDRSVPGVHIRGDVWYEPYVFVKDYSKPDELATTKLRPNYAATYYVETRSLREYIYDTTLAPAGGYKWGLYVDNVYIGRKGSNDYYVDGFGTRMTKVGWSIYPDRFWSPGWIDNVALSPESNYQYSTGMPVYFLEWIGYGGASMNYHAEAMGDHKDTLFLWELNEDTTPESLYKSGKQYLGIQMKVHTISGKKDTLECWPGTSQNGADPIPNTKDPRCMNSTFKIEVVSDHEQEIEFYPSPCHVEAILAPLNPYNSAFENHWFAPTEEEAPNMPEYSLPQANKAYVGTFGPGFGNKNYAIYGGENVQDISEYGGYVMSGNEFIDKIAPMIVSRARQYGYAFPSAIIAQAFHESGGGKSKLSAEYNQYFGIKAPKSYKGRVVTMNTQEHDGSSYHTVKTNFTAFNSMEDNVEYYFKFIQSNRYQNLKSATSPQDYWTKLGQDGYYTAPIATYVAACQRIYDQYNLGQYDQVGLTTNYIEASQVVKLDTDQLIAYNNNVDIEQLAKDVIRGKYGNGQTRKDKLGANYEAVQKRVNELLKK